MKYSVHLPTAAEGLAHPVPFADASDLTRIAIRAEELGFDGVWGNYHVTTQSYVRQRYEQPPNYFDTLIVLAAVAANTRQLEIGTALLFPGLFPVPVLAKQAATLDHLSGGRLRLGFGVGAYREELEALWPGRQVHRGRWLDETLESLLAVLSERRVSYSGNFVVFDEIESFPKPVQDPLPIYVGGHGVQAIERAARFGHGWLPGWQPPEEMRRRIKLLRERLSALNRPSNAVEVAPQLSVTIGRSDAAAERAYWSSGLVEHRRSLAYTKRDLSRQVEANLIGSAATIRSKVEALTEMGVDHCAALWFSTDTVDDMLEQMEWFSRDVMRTKAST